MTFSHNHISPLRYPGGKAKLAQFLEDIVLLNNFEDKKFYELYAGGAAAALFLLTNGICKSIILNDYDFHVYAFWYCVLNHTDELVKLIENASITVDTWQIQRKIYLDYQNYSILEVGFSTFFLNRCNRSGILHRAGPIGGKNQTGNYKIDVRFNKSDLIKRIQLIASYRNKVKLHNLETIDLVKTVFEEDPSGLVFLDPPYFVQGERLYLSFYANEDHLELRNVLDTNKSKNWILTYDNCEEIRTLYSTFRNSNLNMSYTLQEKKLTKEIVIYSDDIFLPRTIRFGNKSIPYQLTEPYKNAAN